MRPRPDPLQRLALLRHDGLVVDVPASATEDDEKRDAPSIEAAEVVHVVEAVAGVDPVPDGVTFRPDADGAHRRRRAEGSPPISAGGSNEPERDRLMGPTDPIEPEDGSVVIQQDSPTVSRAPGRHRHRREGAPARTEVGGPPGGEIQRAEAVSAFGGWVPDDDGGDGGDGDDGDGDDGGGGHGDDGGGVGDGGVGDGGVGADLADPGELDAPRIRARRLGNRPWGRLAELWVPESLRDARIDPGRRGLLVLVLVAAVAAVATAIGVWRDRPEPRPVEAVALAPASNGTGLAALASVANPADPPTSGAAPISGTAPINGTTANSGSGAMIASTAPSTEIVVSVTGLVAHPGVVTLPAGARVTEAIAAAGGSTAEADLTGLNLAAKLVDGDSVVIAGAAAGTGSSGVSGAGSAHSASPASPAASPGQRGSTQLIDLNTADEAALDSLPGVGPVMAQNILAWREQNGRFSTVEQLQEISGIGPARYAQISALVTVS